MKRTPLYETHVKYSGKMIDFEGWELPVQYSGIIDEHCRVREGAGLFDVSHMGEIIVKGDDAEKYVQNIITNDISKASKYQAVYSPICYPDGGVVDDLLVYKLDSKSYLLVVNASNTEKDFEWFKENKKGDVDIKNISGEFAQIAIQGPKAENILQKITNTVLSEIGFFHFEPEIYFEDIKALVSRTGYTGEDGFEIYISPENAERLWNLIMKTGYDEGIVPAGLGARDTLRFEAALPLYGHEISNRISPLEAGLRRFVSFEKDAFIGKEALKVQQERGITRSLVGFEMLERGVPRNNYELAFEGKKIGFVTTGGYSPSLNRNIGMAMVDNNYSKEGIIFDVLIRNKSIRAKVIKTPFIPKRKFLKRAHGIDK